MAVVAQIIRIFLSSPSDLSEEREALDGVVRELNLTLGNPLGLRLELLRWETNAFPGVGTEPQALIDRQIGDDYDIFIGILGTRFGTPTGDAESGTEHEFQRAYQRYLHAPSALRIMFYFKDDRVSPSQIDAEQLLKVQRFRKELSSLGSLFWTYQTPDQFVDLVRVHLTRQLQTWGREWGAEALPRRVPSADQTPTSQPSSAEERGFLDLFEDFEDNFSSMGDVLARMTNAVETLGQKLQERTVDLNRGQLLDLSSRVRHSKRVTNALAGDMRDFSARTAADIPLFGNLYRLATSALARAATMSGALGDQADRIRTVLAPMRELKNQLFKGKELVGLFRDTIKSSPKATADFIGAQSQVVSVLDSLEREYEGVIRHTTELANGLEDLTKGPNSSEQLS